MILLIAGASHTGKTLLAQKLLEKYGYPYFSIDHLKMGLISSKNTILTPLSDDKVLTNYLWPIIKEMIKTAIENNQNIIIEGCYIPFDWTRSFEKDYIEHIKYCCLVMSKSYIQSHYNDIKKYANIIEKRLDDSNYTIDSLINDNIETLRMCKLYHVNYFLIDTTYDINIDCLFKN